MQPPDWFLSAVSTERQDHYINIAGAKIHYQTWSNSDKQGLLFVHGHAAHAHWWDFIAPHFIEDFAVGAIDMSGNGDSEHREQYGVQLFAEEIITVARQVNKATGRKPILVAHSFGGSMSRIAAHLHGDQLGGLVLVDSMISNKKVDREPPVMPKQKDRVYDSLDAAKRRFRLRPPQPRPAVYILDYIAEHSLRHDQQGYRFKLDPAVLAKMDPNEAIDLPDAATMVKQLNIPTAFIYGEESRFFPTGSHKYLTSLFDEAAIAMIPDAHHHVFLDNGPAFISALKKMLTVIDSASLNNNK